VVQDVLRRSAVPVLVVATRRLPRDPRGLFTRRVVGAIELSSTARHDARRVARVAQTLGAPLTLLHVVAPTPGPPWFAPELQAHEQPRLVAAQARLDALANAVKADSRVVLGDPHEEIPSVAEHLKAGLIVMTLRPGHGLFGKRQGTTTYQVLCTSTIPVLALPSTGRR
jgi:nucleotide-binding universal stress UspA family protein